MQRHTTRPEAPLDACLSWQDRRLGVGQWRLLGDAPAEDRVETGPSAREVVERARDMAGPSGLRHLVVGVIGPRAATDRQRDLARQLGQALARLTVTMICGGRGGVMEAVSLGMREGGGLGIGILPGYDPADANAFVGIALPTGLNEGRNMVIARAARVLIAVGGSYGTLTEIAYGLHFGKTVIALDDAPEIEGVTRVADIPAAIDACCAALLRAAEAPTPADDAASASSNGHENR